jgi:hypothetical protein
VQPDAPAAEYCPLAQLAQLAEPAAAAKLPAAQDTQAIEAEEPVNARYEPDTQLSHAEEFAALYLPMAHGTCAAAPRPQYEPDGHELQPTDPVVAAKEPLLHAAHTDWPVAA